MILSFDENIFVVVLNNMVVGVFNGIKNIIFDFSFEFILNEKSIYKFFVDIIKFILDSKKIVIFVNDYIIRVMDIELIMGKS